MRERLIELLDQNCGCVNEQKAEILADYLLANGVIVPPCKLGDTVYRVAHNKDRSEYKIVDFWEVVKIEIYEDEILIIDDSDNYITVESIGKTVFLTKEEAENALKERKEDERK